jgi:hypothetical protein
MRLALRLASLAGAGYPAGDSPNINLTAPEFRRAAEARPVAQETKENSGNDVLEQHSEASHISIYIAVQKRVPTRVRNSHVSGSFTGVCHSGIVLKKRNSAMTDWILSHTEWIVDREHPAKSVALLFTISLASAPLIAILWLALS